MSDSFAEKKWPWHVLWALLIMATLMVSAILLHPEWRVRVQAYFMPEKKELLATVSGDLLGDGQELKILKFATARGLVVEVHAAQPDALKPFTLVDKIFIPDRHDGFFSLNSQATRLALVDVDGDGKPEIIAPSFDDKLVAHLNTLRLDPDTRRLELVKPATNE
ncbi:MAG: hypothetical protein AB7N80_11725 [Bdellovibrionales bacterium]